MPRRRKRQPIEEQGDGLVWSQFLATAEGLDPAEVRERERLAHALVIGTLDLRAWLAGEP